ncbi:MAG: ankyrin repeat domain-containing protein [Acetobacteraceae bacterium]|nr:ankyrin repeat domain-containing protein [Acetobacteraceae bacterium]
MNRLASAVAVLGLGILAAGLAASDAHAQIMAGPGMGRSVARSTAGQDGHRAQPPAALPGASVDKEMVAPPDRPPSEMQPNEALFDAINRGDIASARDAINRGAELDAKNVLGMTPLELSVDLGRRDISFLLLSMRGGGGGVAAPPSAKEAAAAPPKGKQGKPVRAERKPVTPPTRNAAEPSSAPPRTPRLFAGDGGAPVPDAGFLGFGGP